MKIDGKLLDAITSHDIQNAVVQFPPMSDMKLRPNMLYDILYEKSVLHLGCTDHLELLERHMRSGRYLHRQLTRIARECLGVDINEKAAEFLRERGISNIVIADITQPGIEQITGRKWDYLLMAEMLEHVDNPVAFLQSIARNYKDNIDKVLITVPNSFGGIFINHAFNSGTEAINNDHRYWFTPYTICKVVHQAGLVLDELMMCVYEMSEEFSTANRDLLLGKPLLMDSIILTAHF